MQNFNWTQFTKRVYINKDLKMVYDAWTKSNSLETWFLSKALFTSKDDEEISPFDSVKAGNSYSWNWYAQNHLEKGSILSANGTDSLAFTFAGNCKVKVQLSKEGNQTLVELTQTEIPQDDNSKQNIRLGCDTGWAFYMLNLKSVLEGGIDLRNKDKELKGVINN